MAVIIINKLNFDCLVIGNNDHCIKLYNDFVNALNDICNNYNLPLGECKFIINSVFIEIRNYNMFSVDIRIRIDELYSISGELLKYIDKITGLTKNKAFKGICHAFSNNYYQKGGVVVDYEIIALILLGTYNSFRYAIELLKKRYNIYYVDIELFKLIV